MTGIQSTGPSLQSFIKAADKGEAVALKGGEVHSAPAKTGFFDRVVQWIRGDLPSRVNSETKAAFIGALIKVHGGRIAEASLKHGGFEKSVGKPLTSREVSQILKKAVELQLEKKERFLEKMENKLLKEDGGRLRAISNMKMMLYARAFDKENHTALDPTHASDLDLLKWSPAKR